LAVLQAGGNAIDAAIATAAALTVVEPTANGIGGDAFALVWHGGKLHGLNASGPAPRGLRLSHLTDLGHTTMPKYGPLPVTVPGTPGRLDCTGEPLRAAAPEHHAGGCSGAGARWFSGLAHGGLCLAAGHPAVSRGAEGALFQTLVRHLCP
jgi:hypothetical protein